MMAKCPAPKWFFLAVLTVFALVIMLNSTIFSSSSNHNNSKKKAKKITLLDYVVPETQMKKEQEEKEKEEESKWCQFLSQCHTEEHFVKDFISQGLVDLTSFLGEPDQLMVLDNPDNTAVVLFVSCNWYDSQKAWKVVTLMQQFPNASVVLTGGLGRLSSQHAENFGGEALEFRDLLINRFQVEAKRLVVITGLHTTGDNVDFMLRWVEIMVFQKDPLITRVHIVAIEESFLIRRLRATILGRMAEAFRPRKIVVQVVAITPENATVTPFVTLSRLAKLHSDSYCLMAYFISQEMHRLVQYSNRAELPYLFDARLAFGSHPFPSLMRKTADMQTEFKLFFSQVEELLQLGGSRIAVRCIGPR